jgi:hypothetical protein
MPGNVNVMNVNVKHVVHANAWKIEIGRENIAAWHQ